MESAVCKAVFVMSALGVILEFEMETFGHFRG